MKLPLKLRERTLLFLGPPLPPPESVREFIIDSAPIDYLVIGDGLTDNYLRESGLENSSRIAVGWTLSAWFSMIQTLREEVFEETVLISRTLNPSALLTAALSGSCRRLYYYPMSGNCFKKRISLFLLFFQLIKQFFLSILILPISLLPRVVFAYQKRNSLRLNKSLSFPQFNEDFPPVSIIIPNYNGIKLIKKCLPTLLQALEEYSADGEIIVIDDASDDNSAEWIKFNYPAIQVIELTDNQGFGQASNLGINAARNRAVILLNSDIIVEPDFIHPLIDALRVPDVFAVQPRMDTWSGDGLDLGVNVGHMVNGYIRIWNEAETGNRRFMDSTAANLYAVGGAMAFDKMKWDALGGFDDIFYPFCWEDIDISYRAWKRGWKVLYEPASRVKHFRSGTISRFFSSEYKRIIERRNELLFTWKNIHSPRLWKKHLCYLPALILKSLFTGDITLYRAFWRALGKLPRLIRARRKEAACSRRSDEEVFRRSLLPFENWKKRGFQKKAPGAKPQLLIINTVIPFPPIDGGKLRLYQMMKNLSSRYDIHFIAFRGNEEDLEAVAGIEKYCAEIDIVPLIPRPLSCLRRALTPEFCQGWISREMEEKIKEIIRARPLDLVQIDLTLMMYYGRFIKDIPKIFVELDAGILKLGESYNPAYRGWKKILEFYEWLRMLRFELNYLPDYRVIVALNEDDTRLLASFRPDLDYETVTMGTDLEMFLDPYRPIDNNQILYVGSLGHYPNVDALGWFIRKIFPEIRRAVPEAFLKIVGSGTPAGIGDILDRPGIEYIGPVEDVRPFLREAEIFVAPVRLGSGMKGKVLEALAMAKPLVGTSVAARGIPVVSGKHMLIADDQGTFAGEVIRLLRQPALREKLAQKGQALIRENFGWKKKADEMDKVYRTVLRETYG